MMQAWWWANLGMRFLLELCVFAAWAFWGAQAGQGFFARLGFGVGAAMAAIVVWGLFIAPRAPVKVPVPVWVLLQVIIFAVAVAGLVATGYPRLAGALALLLVINSALLYLTGADATDS